MQVPAIRGRGRTVKAARLADLLDDRVRRPGRIAELAEQRERPASLVGQTGRLMLVAADHPARGALRAGAEAMAMADRPELLRRLVVALDRPGVDGVLGTADILEDLLLLGALEGKVVIGSMNRGGLAGTSFEIDDRFTAYHAGAIERRGFQGGKMLLRIDPQDAATAPTLVACADAVNALADRSLMAMVEPFISHRVEGRVRNDLTAEAVIRSATVAAGLGWTSAHTWLKLPVVDSMDEVLAATTLPVLLLGGEVGADQQAQFTQWSKALDSPQVKGMVAGRSMLYPPGGDVAAAVDATVEMM
jgi:DhnA family fructose-bisphosphate aldolase class Ia